MKFRNLIEAFTYLIIIYSLSGCMDIRAVDKNHHDPEGGGPVTESGLRVEARPEFHKYRVIIPVPGGDENLLRLSGGAKTGGEISSVVKVLKVQGHLVVDDDVLEGRTYNYGAGVDDDEVSLKESLKITIPTDIEVKGQRSAADPEVAALFPAKGKAATLLGRVRFDADSVLTTGGRDLILKAAVLDVGDRVLIQTFPSNAKASTPAGVKSAPDGRSGGRILIDATLASGGLDIVLRGEDGADGLAGPEPDNALVGAPGAPGTSGTRTPLTGQGPHGECETRGGSPGSGSRGLKGYPGGPGGNGGATGHVENHVPEKNHFNLYISVEPGHGGQGGTGGEGGPGGWPGPAGDCGEAGGATQGPRGPQGDRGPNGADGLDNSGIRPTSSTPSLRLP